MGNGDSHSHEANSTSLPGSPDKWHKPTWAQWFAREVGKGWNWGLYRLFVKSRVLHIQPGTCITHTYKITTQPKSHTTCHHACTHTAHSLHIKQIWCYYFNMVVSLISLSNRRTRADRTYRPLYLLLNSHAPIRRGSSLNYCTVATVTHSMQKLWRCEKYGNLWDLIYSQCKGGRLA